MNARAMNAAGLLQKPTVTSGAIVALRTTLAQFRVRTLPPAATWPAGCREHASAAKHDDATRTLFFYTWRPRGRPQARSGEQYATFMKGKDKWGFNVARVTAMHICRLLRVLERLFAPGARLYAPNTRKCADAAGRRLDCEWTLGAFVSEHAALKASA